MAMLNTQLRAGDNEWEDKEQVDQTVGLLVLGIVPLPSGVLLWHRSKKSVSSSPRLSQSDNLKYASSTTHTCSSSSSHSSTLLSLQKSVSTTATRDKFAVLPNKVVETLITNVLELCPFFDALQRFFADFDAAAATALRHTTVKPQLRYSALMHIQHTADIWEEALTEDTKHEHNDAHMTTGASATRVKKARAAFLRILYPTIYNHQHLRGSIRSLRQVLQVVQCLSEEELGCCFALPVATIFDTPMSLIDTRPTGLRRRQLSRRRPLAMEDEEEGGGRVGGGGAGGIQPDVVVAAGISVDGGGRFGLDTSSVLHTPRGGRPVTGRGRGAAGRMSIARGRGSRGRYGARIRAQRCMDIPHPELDDICGRTSVFKNEELVSRSLDNHLVLRLSVPTAPSSSGNQSSLWSSSSSLSCVPQTDDTFHWHPPRLLDSGAAALPPNAVWNRLDPRAPSPLSVWGPRDTAAEDRPALLGLCRFDNGHPNHRGFLALVAPLPNNTHSLPSGTKLHEPDPIPDFITV